MNCIIFSPLQKNRNAIEKVIKENHLLKVLKSVSRLDDAADILLGHKKVDIVFIEIEKPGMGGWGMLDELPHGSPSKVFLSTKKELAKEAFDYAAADFILLPLTPLRLLKSIGKLNANKSILTGSVSQNHIFIKINKTFVKLLLKDLLYIKALSDYVKINTSKNDVYIVHSTMKAMLDKLPENEFIRVHKSYIVRMDSIHQIGSKEVAIDHITIPISRSYRQSLMERIEILN